MDLIQEIIDKSRNLDEFVRNDEFTVCDNYMCYECPYCIGETGFSYICALDRVGGRFDDEKIDKIFTETKARLTKQYQSVDI